ncbi:MAG TPA: DNA-binding domain-containing protein, partial [Methylocella sp.]|nr:DNA-binding domain-containing protein [Methylocella sp.]
MKFAELQLRFQDGILHDDQAILSSIADSPRTGRATLFAVYHNAYRLRLAEFLSNDFPVLRNFLGDEAFGGLVEDYILATPSRHPNARWYGARLPDFMMNSPKWQTGERAIDLARFERALSEAFDAADAPVSAIEALADIGVEDWPRLILEFHPSVRLLDLSRGTAQTYGALDEDKEPPTAASGEEAVLFWRSGGESCYRLLEGAERLALLEAQRGTTFGEICALVAFQRQDEDAAPYAASCLSQWYFDGIVS